jgi:hypothetical protein
MVSGQVVILVLDRTHWEFGTTHQILLCLGLNLVVHRPKKEEVLLLVTNRTDLGQVGQRYNCMACVGRLKQRSASSNRRAFIRRKPD